jgi:hypothetical protein
MDFPEGVKWTDAGRNVYGSGNRNGTRFRVTMRMNFSRPQSERPKMLYETNGCYFSVLKDRTSVHERTRDRRSRQQAERLCGSISHRLPTGLCPLIKTEPLVQNRGSPAAAISKALETRDGLCLRRRAKAASLAATRAS